MRLSVEQAEEREKNIQQNRSKVRKNLVKQNYKDDKFVMLDTPLYRWQAVYLKDEYQLTSTEVWVYARIFNYFWNNNEPCFESCETIAENIACSRNAVQTAIKALLAKGLILEAHREFETKTRKLIPNLTLCSKYLDE